MYIYMSMYVYNHKFLRSFLCSKEIFPSNFK